MKQSKDHIFKRNELFEKAINRISRNDSISIIGEYHIGKTNFIKSLIGEIKSNINFSNYVPIYINLWTYQNEDEILESILEAIFEDNTSIKQSFHDIDIYNSDVLDKLRILNRVIRFCLKNDIFLVLFIDHFDHLSALKNLTDDFWSKLRGFAQDQPNLVIVTASRNEVKTLCHKGDIKGSQFWNTFSDVLFISLFKDFTEVKLFLNSTLNDKESEFLFQLTGGHPGYLKIAEKIYLSNKDNKTNNEISELIYDDLKDHFFKAINLLEQDDKSSEKLFGLKNNYIKSLRTVISDCESVDYKFLNELKSLIKKGYIIQNDKEYNLFSYLFERFCIEHFNIKNLPKAYSGDLPFVFISYSHSDSEIVLLQIDKLQKEGYRIWYDEGIDISEKWRKIIDGKIEKCTKFIFFNSRISSTSYEVNKEIKKFVDDRGKQNYNNDFIMVLLDNLKEFKADVKDETILFVINDCNGLKLLDDEEKYFNILTDKLRNTCRE